MDYTQTLEPRAYYVYAPYRNQSDIPVFDTSQLDFSYAQMFTENQFIGGDRVNDANQLTFAVTSRFTEAGSGLERLQVTLGQRYYFSAQEVTLPGVAPRTNNATGTRRDQRPDHARLAHRYRLAVRHAERHHHPPEPGRLVSSRPRPYVELRLPLH